MILQLTSQDPDSVLARLIAGGVVTGPRERPGGGVHLADVAGEAEAAAWKLVGEPVYVPRPDGLRSLLSAARPRPNSGRCIEGRQPVEVAGVERLKVVGHQRRDFGRYCGGRCQ